MNNNMNFKQDKTNSLKSIVSKIKNIINKKEIHKLKKVCFYYGVPSRINDIDNINQAAILYSNYDIVVFGDEYQMPCNEYYKETKILIEKLRDNDIEIFGYVPCAMENGGKNLDTSSIKKLIKYWSDIKVTGIFYDEFGYDYGNTRKRQNELIIYGKQLGLNAFVNSWRDEYVFSSEPIVLDWMNNFEPNPKRIEPVIDSNDYALYENNFWSVKNNTQLGSAPSTIYRAYEYFNVSKDEYQMTYNRKFGTKIISLDGIYSRQQLKNKNKLRTFSILGSALLNLDGVAFGNESWGSDGYFEEFILPDIELVNSRTKHDVKCDYTEYPKSYKCTINNEKLEMVLDVNPKCESEVSSGTRVIKINNKEISDVFKKL